MKEHIQMWSLTLSHAMSELLATPLRRRTQPSAGGMTAAPTSAERRGAEARRMPPAGGVGS